MNVGGARMHYEILGKSGLKVAELCLGIMTFGKQWGWGSSAPEAKKIIDTYLEAGGNFIDTTNMHSGGTGERLLKDFLKSNRDDVVLAAKYTPEKHDAIPDSTTSYNRKNMIQTLEASLKRLDTDYIDIYWVHARDKITALEEMMRSFDDLVRSGKVLHIGISDTPAWIISKAETLAQLWGWTSISAIQVEYSLAERNAEQDLLPMAAALNIAVTARSPLAGGLLTGKYTRGKQLDSSRQPEKTPKQERAERELAIAREVDAIADELARPSCQVALNWLLRRGSAIPILGVRTAEQLNEHLGCLEFRLSQSQMDRLEKISAIDKEYPHNVLDYNRGRRIIYGDFYDRLVF